MGLHLRITTLLTATLLAITLGGCGSSSTTASAAHAGVPTTHGRPLVILRATLSGRTLPHGSPTGVGDAIIAVHHGAVVCFRFAHLHGFVAATGAVLGGGPAAQPGSPTLALSGGPRLHHAGCVSAPASIISELMGHPTRLFVTITSVLAPSGAVGGQL